MSQQAYEEIGRKLRDARLEHKLELQAAARELHIRPRYLEALEDGAFERLPGSTFITGYLSRYANFLGLDGAETVENYNKLGVVPARTLFYIPEHMRHEQNPSRQLVLGTLSAAIGLTILWVHQQAAPPIPPPASTLPLQPAAQVTPRNAPPRVLACADETVWPPCYHDGRETMVSLPGVKPVRSVLELK